MKCTVAFEALVYEAIEERSALVAEGGTSECVTLKFVLRSGVLRREQK